jgi:hypothetical protein
MLLTKDKRFSLFLASNDGKSVTEIPGRDGITGEKIAVFTEKGPPKYCSALQKMTPCSSVRGSGQATTLIA